MGRVLGGWGCTVQASPSSGDDDKEGGDHFILSGDDCGTWWSLELDIRPKLLERLKWEADMKGEIRSVSSFK